MRALVNPGLDPSGVPSPSDEAASFHAGLAGYRPTPVHALPTVAAELGVGAVMVKDESDRLGLPAFKVLGASWAIECALREHPDARMLVAASAGNHGRAVAHVAAMRGLACRVYLPARAVDARRAAIADEGAQVVVIDGDYEQAVAHAGTAGAQDGVVEIADVGDSEPSHRVIDGYATLFAEAAAQAAFDVIVVPVGVGSLAAAAARFAAPAGVRVIAVEPCSAACLMASLAAGRRTAVPTPGTTMAGLDCAEVSEAAWPSLRAGIHATVTVDDREAHAAMRELSAAGMAIGDCGAAALAALRAAAVEPGCASLRDIVDWGASSRILLIATEGPTDPSAYRDIVS